MSNANIYKPKVMKKRIILFSLFYLVSLFAENLYSQEIVHTIPAPGLRCQDVSWDGTYVWATDNTSRSYYQIDPDDGTVINSIPYPIQVPFSEGITYDGEYLWTCGWEESNGDGSHLFKIDPESGDVLVSFNYPGEYSGNWPHGIAFDGTHLWANNFATNNLDKINPLNAELVDTLPAPDEYSIGVTWEGKYLWTNSFNQGKIFKQDPYSGEILGSASLAIYNMRGLEWDGEYLWTVSWETGTIYKIDVGPLGLPEPESPVFSIYPNPCRGVFFISANIPKNELVKIQALDMQGRMVIDLEKHGNYPATNPIELTLGSLPDGMYFVRMVMPDKVWCEKLILEK